MTDPEVMEKARELERLIAGRQYVSVGTPLHGIDHQQRYLEVSVNFPVSMVAQYGSLRIMWSALQMFIGAMWGGIEKVKSE